MAERQTRAIRAMNSYRRREEAAGWLFAAPALIGFLAFTLLPMLFSLKHPHSYRVQEKEHRILCLGHLNHLLYQQYR